MLFHQGRPRYWIPGYDSAHLAVPALLGLVILLLAVVPAPRFSASGASPGSRAEAQRMTVPAVILSPTGGAVLTPDQLTVIEGLGPAGAVIHLFWFDQALGAPTRAGADGRWRFQVQQLPPGSHALRAVSQLGEQQTVSPPVLFTVRSPGAR